MTARSSSCGVHYRAGGFHRAHQALVIDRLLNAGQAQDLAICGLGLLPRDRRMQQVLNSQDHLYTLGEKAADGTRIARVLGSIIDDVYAPTKNGRCWKPESCN